MAFAGQILIDVGARINKLVRGLAEAENVVKKRAREIQDVGKKLTLSITAPILGVGVAALKAAGDLRKTEVAIESITKSSAKTQQIIGDVRSLATETAFGFGQLAKGAQLMLAYRFEAERAVPALRNTADAVAAIGGGNEEITRAIRALGQIQAKGRLAYQEILQLTELGIDVRGILAEAFGVTVKEIEAMIEKGLDGRKAVEAILAGWEKAFGGTAKRQAEEFIGLWGRLLDTVSIQLQKLGKDIIKALDLKGVLRDLISGIKSLGAAWDGLEQSQKRVALALGIQAAAIGPLLVAIGGVMTALPILAKGFTALAGVIAVVGGPLTILIGLFSAFVIHSGGVGNAIKKLNLTLEAFFLYPIEKILQLLVELGADKIPLVGRAISKLEHDVRNRVSQITFEINKIEEAANSVGNAFEDARRRARRSGDEMLETFNRMAGQMSGGPRGISGLPPAFFMAPPVPEGEMGPPILPDIGIYEDAIDRFDKLGKLSRVLGGNFQLAAEKSNVARSAIEQLIDAGIDPADSRIQELKQHLIDNQNAWEVWATTAVDMATSVGNLIFDTFSALAVSLSDAIGQALVYTQDLGRATVAIMKQITAQLISQAIQLTIEYIKQQAIQKAATLGQTATHVQAKAAETYASVFSANASIPIIGPAIAAAEAKAAVAALLLGAAAALATTFAVKGLAEGGVVRSEGIYRLAEGNKPEIVGPFDQVMDRLLPEGGAETHVYLELDGREVAHVVAPHVTKEIRRQVTI